MKADLVEHFLPLGSVMRLETNSPAVLDACRTSFGRYGRPGALESRRTEMVVRLLVDLSFHETQPWPEPVFRGHGDIFYIQVGRENTAVAQLGERSGIGFLSPAMVKDRVFFRNTFLDCLVLTILTHGPRSTHTYAHASSVAVGTRGLVFSGPSGSGKSTLAYACARAGFRFVSDDVVYLREGQTGLELWGKPWRLRLGTDYTRLFPELAGSASDFRFDGHDCVEVEVEKVLPGRTQTRCRPEAVFFLEPPGRGPLIVPVEPERALRLFARDLVHDQPEVLERHRRFWQALIRRGAYILRRGEDLETVVRRLRDFVESRPPAGDP